MQHMRWAPIRRKLRFNPMSYPPAMPYDAWHSVRCDSFAPLLISILVSETLTLVLLLTLTCDSGPAPSPHPDGIYVEPSHNPKSNPHGKNYTPHGQSLRHAQS
jgi:hypothetical protein